MADGIEYPFPPLAEGEALEVAEGLHWVRMPLPFALDHINLWLLEDGGGWTVVDTGYNTDAVREAWLGILERLGGGAPERTICSHFHPDHMGLAGWFAERWGAPLWAPYSEWLQAHVASARLVTHDFARWDGFFAENGAAPETIAGARLFRDRLGEPWHRLPDTVRRIADGQEIQIGGHSWRVITGGGHTHEHASLWCAERGILISGDQILPRITSNISVWYTEPDGDPLGDYLASLDKFGGVPGDALVLPSHDRPFRGIHGRIDALRRHHDGRLDAALAACKEPRTADEVLPRLFDREIGPAEYNFAISETLAHLNRLVRLGRLRRDRDPDGLTRFRVP